MKKNFENRIIISEVMAKSLVSCFFDSRCSSMPRRAGWPCDEADLRERSMAEVWPDGSMAARAFQFAI